MQDKDMLTMVYEYEIVWPTSSLAGIFKCNPLNICVTFYTILTDTLCSRGPSSLAELLV